MPKQNKKELRSCTFATQSVGDGANERCESACHSSAPAHPADFSARPTRRLDWIETGPRAILPTFQVILRLWNWTPSCRHCTAAARQFVTDGCMEDCREVIFTRLRRHRASEELLRRIRRLNSVWARPTVKEKDNEKPICVHITYIIILRRSYDIRLSRDIAAVAVKFIFGLMMRVLEEEYATLLH